jgi:hypothetical protein
MSYPRTALSGPLAGISPLEKAPFQFLHDIQDTNEFFSRAQHHFVIANQPFCPSM